MICTVEGCAQAAVLTLEQAIELADRNHPQLKAGVAQMDAAAAAAVTARAYPNPEAGIMAGRQTFRVPGNVTGINTNYTFSQPLELGQLRSTRLRYAEQGRDSSRHALAGIRLGVLSGVRRAFFQALRKQGEIAILEENLRLVEEFRKRTAVRVEVGEAGRLELIRAEAELATARSALSTARLEYIANLSQLRAAIGTTIDPALTPQGAVDPSVVLPPLESVTKDALSRHPAVELARSEVTRAEARLAYENAQRRPQPALRAEVDRPPDTPTYRVGISIPLPFWNRREGPIAESEAQLRQSKALLDSRQLEILAAIESAYGRYQVATQQLAAFEQGLLKEAEEAARAAETAYRLGERGILDVLDAQRVLRTVRVDFLKAQFDRQAALIDLDELRAVELRKQEP